MIFLASQLYAGTRSDRNHGGSQDNHRPVLCTQHLPNGELDRKLTIYCLQILAIGFLLVILSSALFKNYLPLLVVATYVIAPIPNWVCGKAQGSDDFMDNGNNSIVELGRFLTGFLVVMGIGEYTHMNVQEA